jgi:hypothetical protein
MPNFANLGEALEYAEAPYREAVKVETWGHLAPKKNRTYKGRVVFGIGVFGDDELNPCVLVSEFKGLDSSPWFYDCLTEFLSDLQCKKPRTDRDNGKVFEWVGTFRNYEMNGKIRLLFDAN